MRVRGYEDGERRTIIVRDGLDGLGYCMAFEESQKRFDASHRHHQDV